MPRKAPVDACPARSSNRNSLLPALCRSATLHYRQAARAAEAESRRKSSKVADFGTGREEGRWTIDASHFWRSGRGPNVLSPTLPSLGPRRRTSESDPHSDEVENARYRVPLANTSGQSRCLGDGAVWDGPCGAVPRIRRTRRAPTSAPRCRIGRCSRAATP